MKKMIAILLIAITMTLFSAEKYAVLIAGDYNPTDIWSAAEWNGGSGKPYTEFWNDTYLMWELLTQEKGFKPDVLVIDYLDKMGTVDRVPRSDMFIKDQIATEELYELGNENNFLIITASQQNRAALSMEKKDQSVIAGGISKINEADVYGSIISEDIHRDNGEFLIKWLKTRTSGGVGKVTMLQWCPESLRIKSFPESERRAREMSYEECTNEKTHRTTEKRNGVNNTDKQNNKKRKKLIDSIGEWSRD